VSCLFRCFAANIITVCDLLLAKPVDISKKCRLTPAETKQITDAVCKDCAQVLRPLHQVKYEGDEKFTTGDVLLNRALGGGIRTGMIWEIFGER
jgi:DNA repair protein RAD57